jgi:lycopene cyclase domain-containing protein
LSYTLAAGVAVVTALLLDLVVLGTRLVLGRVFWLTYPIVLAGQLVSNGILTGRRIVRYDPHAILGLRVAYAPVEDLAFGFALVLTALALWVRLGQHANQRR